MFGLTNIRLIGYGLIAAFVGFLLIREHVAVAGRKAEHVARLQAETALVTERANRAIEQADHRRADDAAKATQTELDRIRSQPVLTGVRCTAPRLSKPTSESGTASSADASHTGRESPVLGEDPLGTDVSLGLTDYGKKCEATAATLSALQAWETARTH